MALFDYSPWRDLQDVATQDWLFRTYVDAAIQPGLKATAPPTSTSGALSSNDPGSQMWLLPLGLVAFGCGSLVLVYRRQRRIG